ncbi:MAG: hypothetical protein KatS3mg103_0956 [Phycisphaerales bacterium]|nr:MAG: hypothetical protein KatS3mg103_0956 [Phycisphaerales bacterium]
MYPAWRMRVHSTGSLRQYVVPAEDTTFSSIMTLPMSLAPNFRATWPTCGPIVTQLLPME